MMDRLGEIAARILSKWEGELLEFNGEADHLHLLVSIPPKVAPADLVNNLKTVTSRLIRKEFGDYLERFYRKPVFWSRSYCIITCGGAPLSVLKQYIEQQGKD
jgi:putative transposase